MAAERQSPDAVLSSSNLSGGVADIQDDPDAPDANWMVASGNNVNTDARTSFPTPTGNPTVGADLQEFKAWVRQFDEGQTGTPQVRIELWENGVLVRAGTNENVTTSGHMVTFTWNANELGTADGSLVECKVVGTKTGGSPGKRNTVDVGAVEWNVEYTTGGTTYYETLATTETGVLTFATTSSFFRTLASTEISVASLVKKMFSTLSVVESSIASLVTALLSSVALAAAEIASATLSRILTWAKTLSVVESSVVSLTRTSSYFRSLSVLESSITSLIKEMYNTLSVTEVSTATLSTIKTIKQAISATMVGIASLATQLVEGGQTFYQTLSATLVGSPVIAVAKINIRALTVATAGISQKIIYIGGRIYRRLTDRYYTEL